MKDMKYKIKVTDNYIGNLSFDHGSGLSTYMDFPDVCMPLPTCLEVSVKNLICWAGEEPLKTGLLRMGLVDIFNIDDVDLFIKEAKLVIDGVKFAQLRLRRLENGEFTSTLFHTWGKGFKKHDRLIRCLADSLDYSGIFVYLDVCFDGDVYLHFDRVCLAPIFADDGDLDLEKVARLNQQMDEQIAAKNKHIEDLKCCMNGVRAPFIHSGESRLFDEYIKNYELYFNDKQNASHAYTYIEAKRDFNME